MRRYETICIMDPDLSEEGRVPVFDRLTELIPQQGGTLLEFDEWGLKKLAYAIKKKPRGYYVRVDYCGNGKVVDEMERFFRIDDRVLKYMTVLLEEEADVDSLLAALAPAEAEAETAADSAPAAEPAAPEAEAPEADAVTDEKPKTETIEEA